MIKLFDYAGIIGKQNLELLYKLASSLSHSKVKMINSTRTGGGVAEILQRMVPLLNQLGIQTEWNTISGDGKFFQITKTIHNSLHGGTQNLSDEEKEHFLEINKSNSEKLQFKEDFIFIHDPQPVALIKKKDSSPQKWVWRCHIDVSSPHPEVWKFILPFVEQYNGSIFSAPAFAQRLPIPQFLISPSIDPLSDKNKELKMNFIEAVLEKYALDPDRPILTQVSRFDRLKDPLGVIEAYKMVKRSIDCQLVLCGGGATDDPEGESVLNQVKEKAAKDKDIHIIFLPSGSDLEINALQRASNIIIQKSIKEGFGLTVTEGLWKKKPVIGSAVGGIPLQIIHNQTGILVYSIEGTSYQIKYLLTHPEIAKKLGENGYEHVRQNFLITRHLRDYLLTMLFILYPEQSIVLLN